MSGQDLKMFVVFSVVITIAILLVGTLLDPLIAIFVVSILACSYSNDKPEKTDNDKKDTNGTK